jgi:hypothetical protein
MERRRDNETLRGENNCKSKVVLDLTSKHCSMKLYAEWLYRSTFSKPQHYSWIGGWLGPRPGLDDVEKRKLLTQLGFNCLACSHPSCQKCYENKIRYRK